MTDEIDYTNDSLFPTCGLLPEVDKIRDRKIWDKEIEDSCIYCLSKLCVGTCSESNLTDYDH